MKHVKMLGLLVMAAASLMAFASSASAAPVLTGPKGEEYTGTIHATLEPETSATLKANIEDTCTESTAHGIVSVNNETHAEGALTTNLNAEKDPEGLTFNKCTRHTTVINPGKLTINDKGEVFTIGSRVRVTVTGLATCYYGAETGSVKVGNLIFGHPATMKIETSVLQKEKESTPFWCAETGTWTGSYNVTTPSGLTLT